jgi:hypothetical protein
MEGQPTIFKIPDFVKCDRKSVPPNNGELVKCRALLCDLEVNQQPSSMYLSLTKGVKQKVRDVLDALLPQPRHEWVRRSRPGMG